MVKALTRVLLGTVACFSVGAIASPSQAAVLNPQNITFDSSNYRTYTGGSSGTFSISNANAAVAALQDNDPTSNVELWQSTENPTSNVGFSSTLGTYTVTVQSVTTADWAVFGSQWMNDFLASNSQMSSLWSTLNPNLKAMAQSSITTSGLPSSGDPNVGSLTLDSVTGELKLDLIGHFDLKPRILAKQYTTGNAAWDSVLFGLAKATQGPIQASEIAKVTIGNSTYYAYGFNATSTGISTNDGSESYTGRYTWTKTLAVAPPPESTPEPSSVVGSVLVAGTLAALGKLKAKA